MGCFKPRSYHSDHVVAKYKSMGDTPKMKYFIKLLFCSLDTTFVPSPLRLFLWELLCEVAMNNNSDVYQMQHNECRAINNPAIRGELINS